MGACACRGAASRPAQLVRSITMRDADSRKANYDFIAHVPLWVLMHRGLLQG